MSHVVLIAISGKLSFLLFHKLSIGFLKIVDLKI